MADNKNLYEVIVIGAGVHGCAAAQEFAKHGYNTALIDQFPIPHGRGSSAGHSRIIRYAHNQCSQLTKIMKDSFDDWLSIQMETGIELFRHAKLLAFSNVQGNTLQKMASSSRECGGKPVFKSVMDMNAEYNVSMPANTSCLEDSSAGVLLADKCISALLKLFEHHKGTIIGNWPVSKIVRISDDLIKVEGMKGHMMCHKLIICAGPWTSDLLIPLGLELPLTSIKVAVFYWKVLSGKPYFSFMHESDNGYMYGLPAIEYPGLMKLAWDNGVNVHPNERDNADISKLKDAVVSYVKNHFPMLQQYPSVEEACMYTNTPDGEMILDRHPKYPNILFACGFSGRGFKIAPVVATIFRKMASDPTLLDQSLDLEPFKMKRFESSLTSSKL